MTTIQVHVPVVEDAPAAPVDLASRVGRDVVGGRLVLIDNGKPKARDLLAHLGDALAERLSLDHVELVSKSSAAFPVEDAHADEIAARADLVVTGLGDCGACSACSLQDALLLERRGVPATVLITDVFVAHVARFAANLGSPGYHHLVVPHPAATKSDDRLRTLARASVDAAVEQLRSAPALLPVS
ncbi:UGSC family (seleno)protein [Nocardioides alkalitolerans]|uniref:UGSC family (seleno)protein n=1 Tax=Nocardioides alkalitolerans TaxID=281714 RepID=UPI0003F74B88|nr:hypothetical protein [Nocardioides alkalitolerans]